MCLLMQVYLTRHIEVLISEDTVFTWEDWLFKIVLQYIFDCVYYNFLYKLKDFMAKIIKRTLCICEVDISRVMFSCWQCIIFKNLILNPGNQFHWESTLYKIFLINCYKCIWTECFEMRAYFRFFHLLHFRCLIIWVVFYCIL